MPIDKSLLVDCPECDAWAYVPCRNRLRHYCAPHAARKRLAEAKAERRGADDLFDTTNDEE